MKKMKLARARAWWRRTNSIPLGTFGQRSFSWFTLMPATNSCQLIYNFSKNGKKYLEINLLTKKKENVKKGKKNRNTTVYN